MNFSKLLLLFFVLIITMFNAHAGTGIVQASEELIAEALVKKELSVGSTVLYDKGIYIVSEFYVTENTDFYYVSVQLKRQLTHLGVTWGEEYVRIKVKKGLEPMHPTVKIRNTSKADTVHNIETWHCIKLYPRCALVGAATCLTIACYILDSILTDPIFQK